MQGKIIRIVARREGFRRAGIAHSAEPRDYRSEQFTDDQLQALMTEPELIVQLLDAPAEEPEAPQPEGKGKKTAG